MNGSTIGIRSEWRCTRCGETERVYEVIPASALMLALPPGWSAHDGLIYCPQHAPQHSIALGIRPATAAR